MKILFLTDNFPPELNAPATRTYEHCREWVKMGMEVTVITCFPNFPKGEIFPGYKNKLYQVEEMEGIKVIRVWSFIAENKGIVKRFLDFISFAVSGFFAGLFQKNIDKIIITSPQFFVSFSGFLLSVLKRTPWIFEVRDLWPESIIKINNYKKNFFFRLFENIELYFYQNAEMVIAVTEGIAADIKARGIEPRKIKLVRNGFSFTNNINFTHEELASTRVNLKLSESDILISYIGTHGQAHALNFILRAIAKIDKLNLRFLFVGNGAEKENLLKLSRDLNLQNTIFLESVKKQQVFKFIAISQWALVNLKNDPLFLGAIPSKIFENAALKTPILLGVDGEARILIEKYKAGVYFEPEDEGSFLKVLHQIAERTFNYHELEAGAEALAKDFNRSILAKEMLHFITGPS